MKDLFLAFLSKTLNDQPESIAAKLFKPADDNPDQLTDVLLPNALDTLLAYDANRVKSLKPNTEEIFNNGYKKAEKKIALSWENMIKEATGITSESQGKDLLGEALSSLKSVKLDENKVKLHPLYLGLENTHKQQLEKLQSEKDAEISNFKKSLQREGTLKTVKNEARKYFLGLNPVLSTDTAKAENQTSDFLGALDGYEFEKIEDQFYLSKDGKRKEDQHGHAYTLSRFIQERAGTRFDFTAQSEKGNAGNSNQGQPNKTFTLPKSQDEYLNAMYDPSKTADERKALEAAWEKANS